MNRFEQAIYDCMVPTEDLLDETTKPLHRAMLLNFWRHVHLEGAGEYEQIVAPDMMVDEPVYRVTWGVSPAVITGKKGVLAFYNSVGDSVLWHSDDRLAVGDWGICDEITGRHAGAGSRDPPRAVGQARGRPRRALLGARAGGGGSLLSGLRLGLLPDRVE